MVLYEVFSHSILVRYKASVWSKATVFYVIIIVLTFIPPIFIAYRSQGFWQKIGYYREQPDVHFKHKMLLVLETSSPDKLIIWTTFLELYQLLNENVKTRIPSIEHREADENQDGKNDRLHMTIDVPLAVEEILSVKLILLFDYKLYLYSTFHMECLAYIYHSSPLPGASFNIFGELSLHQNEPLKHKGLDTRYNVPIIDETMNDVSLYDFENIFSKYIMRNVTTLFRYTYPVWKSGRAINQPFRITLDVIYPEETIQYKTGFWQLLKWAWIQYVAVLAIFWYICHHIKMYVFKQQIIPTVVFSSGKRDS